TPNSFTGTLDEVRIWARALSAGEIKVSNDMGAQTNVPSEIGQEEEANIAFTKRWEITGAGTANNQVKTFDFDIVTADSTTIFSTCGVSVDKVKNATITGAANGALLAGKSCVLTVTRLDGTKDADVRFSLLLNTGKELEGRIRIKP